MKIFEPDVQEGYEWIRAVNEEDYELLSALAETKRQGPWKPLPMRLIKSDEGASFRESDFPWLGSDFLVLNDRASQVIRPILGDDAELLPLACDQRSLWLVNVHTIVDALDLGRSEVELFEPGRILDIRTHVFYADRLQGINVFKLVNDRRGSTYLSERVVWAIQKAPLVGHGFRLVWTDEEEG